MAGCLEGEWTGMFCEHVQHILDELKAWDQRALSHFMHQETQRVLESVAVLRVPGKPEDLGTGIG